ncbi:MAG: HNH endonuclease [Ktedonobacterales bacterium]
MLPKSEDPQDLLARIQRRVSVTASGCWIWPQESRHKQGYGLMRIGTRDDGTSRVALVHRVVYACTHGGIPADYDVTHNCGRNFPCVNPDHLIALPHQEVVQRGLLGSAEHRKTHCTHGHAYTPENTYTYPNGRRACRACRSKHNGAS